MRRSAANNHDVCLHVCMRIPEVLPWAVHALTVDSVQERNGRSRVVSARALSAPQAYGCTQFVQLYHELYHWGVNGSRYESGHVVAVSRER